MSRSFDYRAASLVAVADHFNTVQPQAFTKLITYYSGKQDTEMLVKLQQARKLSKIIKLHSEYVAEFGVAPEGI